MTTVALQQSTLLTLPLELPTIDVSSITPLFASADAINLIPTDAIHRVYTTRWQEQDAAILSDEELMLALCQGGEWAMQQLYQRYARYVYSLAYRVVHDSFGAEDIVQDVFVSVWRKAISYQESQGSVRSWLQAIVHHRAIDKIRAAANRDARWATLQGDNEQDPPSSAPDVWETVWHNQQSASIRQALASLPAGQRQVIEMSYFLGYTCIDMAEELHLPLGTVKSRMRLALQKLRGLLQEYRLD